MLNEYLHWTLQQSGSQELRSMVVIDECHGIMPPDPRVVATKRPLLSLLKMGRAFGVGVLLASQNPKDVDYKGLSNCATWITGKLVTKNDRDRVIEGLISFSKYDKPTLHKQIGGLQRREFMLAFDETLHIAHSPEIVTPFVGPLSTYDLLTIRDKLGYYQVIECGDKKGMLSNMLESYRKTGLIKHLKEYLRIKGDYK